MTFRSLRTPVDPCRPISMAFDPFRPPTTPLDIIPTPPIRVPFTQERCASTFSQGQRVFGTRNHSEMVRFPSSSVQIRSRMSQEWSSSGSDPLRNDEKPVHNVWTGFGDRETCPHRVGRVSVSDSRNLSTNPPLLWTGFSFHTVTPVTLCQTCPRLVDRFLVRNLSQISGDKRGFPRNLSTVCGQVCGQVFPVL
jgi:hypothetical protein